MKLNILIGTAELFFPVSVPAQEITLHTSPDTYHYTASWISSRCGRYTHDFIADGDANRWGMIGENLALTVGANRTALFALPLLWPVEKPMSDNSVRYVGPLSEIIRRARPQTLIVSALQPNASHQANDRVERSVSRVRQWLEGSLSFDGQYRPQWVEEVTAIQTSPDRNKVLHRNWLWNALLPHIIRLHEDNYAMIDADPYSAYKPILDRWTWLPRPDAPPDSWRELARRLVEKRHSILLQG